MTRTFRLTLTALLALACSSSPSAESALAKASVGTWIGEEAGLLVSTERVILSVPCIGAVFPAIKPASDSSFEMEGFIGDSPKGFANGRPARISGRLFPDSLQVSYAFNLDGEWPEPKSRTLIKDDTANFIVEANCIQ